jgi:hypothetical protein
MTTEDKRAQIDRRFDETFAVFDERMRKEQEALSRERASGTGSSDESGDSAGEEGEDEATDVKGGQGDAAGRGEAGSTGTAEDAGGEGEAGGRGESAGGNDQQGGGGGGVGGGASGGAGPGSVPADIPDGSDDDIVARQLREAAMKEKDPELRARLWEEYRQYKKGS